MKFKKHEKSYTKKFGFKRFKPMLSKLKNWTATILCASSLLAACEFANPNAMRRYIAGTSYREATAEMVRRTHFEDPDRPEEGITSLGVVYGERKWTVEMSYLHRIERGDPAVRSMGPMSFLFVDPVVSVLDNERRRAFLLAGRVRHIDGIYLEGNAQLGYDFRGLPIANVSGSLISTYKTLESFVGVSSRASFYGSDFNFVLSPFASLGGTDIGLHSRVEFHLSPSGFRLIPYFGFSLLDGWYFSVAVDGGGIISLSTTFHPGPVSFSLSTFEGPQGELVMLFTLNLLDFEGKFDRKFFDPGKPHYEIYENRCDSEGRCYLVKQ